jgi:hypothetical protein
MSGCRVGVGRVDLGHTASSRFPFPAHQTGRADFPHPAFRSTSWRGCRWRPCFRLWGSGLQASPSPRHTAPSKASGYSMVFQACANHRSSAFSKACRKSGPFPPPALPGFTSTTILSDSHPCASPRLRSSGSTRWVSHVARFTVPACCAQYPGGPLGARVDCFPSVLPSRLQIGRHPRLHFRDLLGLYAYYGPPNRSTALTAFVTRLRPRQLPSAAARLLPVLSTTNRVDSSSTCETRLRGAPEDPRSQQ